MSKQLYRVYWASNDGDEMEREIGLVFAENVKDALDVAGVWASNACTEIDGEWFDQAIYHAEPITAAYQLEDLLNNLFWSVKYSTCDESRHLLINGAIKEFSIPS